MAGSHGLLPLSCRPAQGVSHCPRLPAIRGGAQLAEQGHPGVPVERLLPQPGDSDLESRRFHPQQWRGDLCVPEAEQQPVHGQQLPDAVCFRLEERQLRRLPGHARWQIHREDPEQIRVLVTPTGHSHEDSGSSLFPSLLATAGDSSPPSSPGCPSSCPCHPPMPVPCSCPPPPGVTRINTNTELALALHLCLCVLVRANRPARSGVGPGVGKGWGGKAHTGSAGSVWGSWLSTGNTDAPPGTSYTKGRAL